MRRQGDRRDEEKNGILRESERGAGRFGGADTDPEEPSVN